jgi:hypothetical protein
MSEILLLYQRSLLHQNWEQGCCKDEFWPGILPHRLECKKSKQPKFPSFQLSMVKSGEVLSDLLFVGGNESMEAQPQLILKINATFCPVNPRINWNVIC